MEYMKRYFECSASKGTDVDLKIREMVEVADNNYIRSI